MHERDIELAYECERYKDLVRWSKLDNPWVSMDTIVLDRLPEDYAYFPIPLQFAEGHFKTLDPRITLSNNQIVDNAVPGMFVGKLYDKDFKENARFMFPGYPGTNNHNHMFRISNDSLFTNFRFVKTDERHFIIHVMSKNIIWEFNEQSFIITKSGIKSVPEKIIQSKRFNLYPNPSCGKVTIHGYPSGTSGCLVRVYDLQGRILLQGKMDKGQIRVDLDLNNAGRGMVLIRLTGKEFDEVHKLILNE